MPGTNSKPCAHSPNHATVDEKFIIMEGHNVFLTEWRWWNQREQELNAWCKNHDVGRLGMFLTFPDQQTLTAFMLKWK